MLLIVKPHIYFETYRPIVLTLQIYVFKEVQTLSILQCG